MTHSRFPPEEQKLVCGLELAIVYSRLLCLLLLLKIQRRSCIAFFGCSCRCGWCVIERRESDAGLEQHKGDGGDAAPVRLQRSVAPFVVFVEPAIQKDQKDTGQSLRAPQGTQGQHHLRHAQHVDEMLLGHVFLPIHIALQSCEYALAC